MKSAQFSVLAVVLAGISILTMGQAALAQGAGGAPETPTAVPYDPAGPGWYPDFPGAMWLDPWGKPWIKELGEAPSGLPWALHESIDFRPPPPGTGLPDAPIRDWHEEILTPGWDWGEVQITVNTPNGPVVPSGLVIQRMPGAVWFYFDPISPPFTLDVWKNLIWTGSPTAPPIFPIRIAEYPTPEPVTAGLLALGGLALMRRRRRSM